ncbi:hypothetical protein J3F84DRAFT_355922 [Trichoderma pleuroticola]
MLELKRLQSRCWQDGYFLQLTSLRKHVTSYHLFSTFPHFSNLETHILQITANSTVNRILARICHNGLESSWMATRLTTRPAQSSCRNMTVTARGLLPKKDEIYYLCRFYPRRPRRVVTLGSPLQAKSRLGIARMQQSASFGMQASSGPARVQKSARAYLGIEKVACSDADITWETQKRLNFFPFFQCQEISKSNSRSIYSGLPAFWALAHRHMGSQAGGRIPDNRFRKIPLGAGTLIQ